jgi:hypothetical protein
VSRQDDIKKLITNHQRRLQKLKELQALQGLSIDPKILIEIEDIETEVKELQTELKELETITELSVTKLSTSPNSIFQTDTLPPTPSQTSTNTPTRSPTSAPTETQTPTPVPPKFHTISLNKIANASTQEGYASPPLGQLEIEGVLFDLPAGRNSVTTQAGPLPDFPTTLNLPSGNYWMR